MISDERKGKENVEELVSVRAVQRMLSVHDSGYVDTCAEVGS
jgi:hypothetical protein